MGWKGKKHRVVKMPSDIRAKDEMSCFIKIPTFYISNVLKAGECFLYPGYTFGSNWGHPEWDSGDVSMEISASFSSGLWKHCARCWTLIKHLCLDEQWKSLSIKMFLPKRNGWGTLWYSEVAEPDQTYSAATRSVNFTTPMWFLWITMGGLHRQE